MRRSAAGLLKRAGHSVESFAGGAEFLASDLSKGLGCILLDMRMPGLDGLAVMRALRERGVVVPIQVLTGHGDIPFAVEAMQLGTVEAYRAQMLVKLGVRATAEAVRLAMAAGLAT